MINLSFKQKNRILLITFLVVSILIYCVPVGQTINAYKETELLSNKIIAAEGAPFAIKELESELLSYKRIIHKSNMGNFGKGEFIIDKVSHACQKYHVSLVAFDVADIYTYEKYQLTVRLFKLNGSFKQLVQAINELEHHQSAGRVGSTKIVLEENITYRTKELVAYVYIQTVQPSSAEM